MSLPHRVFVDTSYFIALLNSRDANHQQAIAIQKQLQEENVIKITSEYVLLELGDGLSKLRFRSLASQLIRLVLQDNTFTIIHASTTLFSQAFSLFENRSDKEWGMTDCASIVIMDELNLTVALTADHHFEQAGYQVLLSQI